MLERTFFAEIAHDPLQLAAAALQFLCNGVDTVDRMVGLQFSQEDQKLFFDRLRGISDQENEAEFRREAF